MKSLIEFFKNSFTNSKKESSNIFKVEQRSIDILALSDRLASETEVQLKERVRVIREKIEKDNSTLDQFLDEIFAIAVIVIERKMSIKLFKVQIMGAIFLHRGTIAEMKTGEGKTITSTLPVILNGLAGKPVYVVTVNEYLVKRDCLENAKIYEFFGLTSAYTISGESQAEKRKKYAADVVYVTHSEAGFDYLRDNTVNSKELKVQRGFDFVIIDEVDSILIDEAKTPLIISGGSSIDIKIYQQVNHAVKTLKVGEDYIVDTEYKTAFLNPEGIAKIEKIFNLRSLYHHENSELIHLIRNSLLAHGVYKKDIEYIVADNKIKIVDNFTGRILEGRSFSNGLHQALQAKENVKIKPELKTVATITYQNFFRMFKKLSGMTGTAYTEEEEFLKVYNVKVVQIPTNLPLIRIDERTEFFATKKEKFDEIVNEITNRHARKQPILVGTRSVEDSEFISQLLKTKGIVHEVLNAKQNSRESEIISNAGKPGTITIATNMAGRGTDIKLQGNTKTLGGLAVIGCEIHESRRIDNQLRGRSGRQGDIGWSKFYSCGEDEIYERFNDKKINNLMSRLKGTSSTSRVFEKILTTVQVRIEGMNFDQRKSVIEYDDVIAKQRLLIYSQRDNVLESKDLFPLYNQLINSVSQSILKQDFFQNESGVINYKNILLALENSFFEMGEISLAKIKSLDSDNIVQIIRDKLAEKLNHTFENMEPERSLFEMQRFMIYSIDMNWQNHIDKLMKLKLGVRFEQYAQRNPVQRYVEISNEMYKELLDAIAYSTIKLVLSNVQREN